MVVQLKKTVQNVAEFGDTFDSMERSIRESVLRLGFQALELFVSLQGKGDLGPEITSNNHETLYRSDKTTQTTIRSIFGVHRFE
jgi:hypothetical protein